MMMVEPTGLGQPAGRGLMQEVASLAKSYLRIADLSSERRKAPVTWAAEK